LILRFTVGGLMLFHGIAKLFQGNAFIEKLLSNHGLPAIIAWGVPLGEVIAPLLLLLGVCTRVSSLLIAFTMVMSIYLALGANAFTLTAYGGPGGELNFLYLLVSLAIFLLGPGRYSLYRGHRFYLQ
jgi:putative oxidoreductase